MNWVSMVQSQPQNAKLGGELEVHQLAAAG